MSNHWNRAIIQDVSNSRNKHYESTLLKLNCEKALNFLDWHATMTFEETVKMTAEWYKSFYFKPEQILDTTIQQIETFMSMARSRGLLWAQ